MKKMRFATRVGIISLATALAAPAIAGEVGGYVVDGSDTVALRSAQVRIVELNRSATTDRDGSFLFTDVPEGEYTIEASYVGAQTVSETVSVPATGEIDVTLQLSPVDGGYDSPIRWAIAPDTREKACPAVAGRHFRGVKNGPAPSWMQRRLTAIGLRPISALVDVTNYVSVDLGRPLHVYDAAKLEGGVLHMRSAKDGETDPTLSPHG